MPRLSKVALVFAAIACSKSSAVTPARDSTSGSASSDTTVTIGKTKLQAFQAKTGAVVVFGFSKVAEIPALYGGSTVIEARELTDATSGARAPGMAVEVKETGTFDRKETSYVDYDELESLLRGIDYIGKIDKNPTRLNDFQAEYRTKGDLIVSTFSGHGGQTMVAVKSGTIGGTSAFYPIARLSAFRDGVARTKALLDSINPTRKPETLTPPP